MAITDYDSLAAAVQDTIKDTTVDAAKARDFISQAEAKLQRDLLSQEYGGSVPRQMLVRTTGQTDNAGKFQLPTDFRRVRTVIIAQWPARYAAPEKIQTNGQPDGVANADIILDYYQRLPALIKNMQTNWLLDEAPDLYLYAATLQYVPWAHAPEVFGLWNGFYSDALKNLKATNGATPSGNFIVQKGRPYAGFYTIIGSEMIFASRVT